jgi:formylglycine-generating enzyme required for sulfatase activity
MPKEGALPAPLKALARRQAIRLSHDRFNADGQGLVTALQERRVWKQTPVVASGADLEKALRESPGGKKAPAAASGDPAMRVRPGSGESFRDGDAAWAPEMVVVPSGAFMMGTAQAEIDTLCKESPGDASYFRGEGPQHKVSIAQPFAVGRFAVTRGEYAAFTKESGHAVPDYPLFAQDDSHPVVCVSWDDAKAYTKWLSGKTDKNYRLLSEAEWEYACRAGTSTPFWWSASISTEQANFFGKIKNGGYRLGTVPVKSFQPNSWGLYQVHGNVLEYCEDCWNERYDGAPADGSAWTAGNCEFRPMRGGSWFYCPRNVRAASRYRCSAGLRYHGVGFRLARTLTP